MSTHAVPAILPMGFRPRPRHIRERRQSVIVAHIDPSMADVMHEAMGPSFMYLVNAGMVKVEPNERR